MFKIGKGKNICGDVFGDFVAQNVVGKDKSSHNIWRCVCPDCDSEITGTVYDLKHKRVDTECKKCKENRLNRIKLTPISKDNNDSDKICSKDSDTSIKIDTGSIETNTVPTNDTVVTNDNADKIAEEIKAIKSAPVTYATVYGDILSAPFYQNIVHCIPGDLSIKPGSMADKINRLTNFKFQIMDEIGYSQFSPELDKVLKINNVYTLFPVSNRYKKPSYDNIETCIRYLAEDCLVNNVKYIAFPQICCGKFGLNWDRLKPAIIKIFDEVYKSEIDNLLIDNYVADAKNTEIHITFYEMSQTENQ